MGRYEQWTAPEYYQTANSNLQNNTEKQNRTVALEFRREKLKKMLDSEKEQYAKEIYGTKFESWIQKNSSKSDYLTFFIFQSYQSRNCVKFRRKHWKGSKKWSNERMKKSGV